LLFDGRMDHSAFYHGYGIGFINVLDVQLVEVASRQARGKGQAAQFGRSQRYLRYINFYAYREAYQQVNKLSGLNECVEEHNAVTSAANLQGSGAVFWLLIEVYLSKSLSHS
jgi:exonuclease 3'-5' domain-containing protein 1